MRNYYYLVTDEYKLADPELIESSNLTFDVTFNELATNKQLLDILELPSDYIRSNNALTWFATYLSSFTRSYKEAIYEKLLTNPNIRILMNTKIHEAREILNKFTTLKIPQYAT